MRRILCCLIAGILLSSCSSGDDDKKKLTGERIDVMPVEASRKVDADLAKLPLTLPPTARAVDWPQMAQTARHIAVNAALGKNLKDVWSVSIGRGESGRRLLTAQPIIAQKHIFTMDTDATVSAFDAATGQKIWQVSTAPQGRFTLALDGGLAYGNGRIYVTNGTRDLWALDAANGGKVWKITLPAIARAAPSVFDDNLYVMTRANQLLALNAANGDIRWQHNGLAEAMGVIGSPSPAADADLVIATYSSGEIYALRADTGTVAWAEGVTPHDAKGGLASLTDLRAPPVLLPDMVVAANYANSAVGIDRRLGERVWSQDFGAINAMQVTGNNIFILNLNGELMAMDRPTGGIRWSAQLPLYKNPEDKDDPITWYGPLLADNTILLMNSQGGLWRVDPANGTVVAKLKGFPPPALTPIIVNNTLYVLDKQARLTAYR